MASSSEPGVASPSHQHEKLERKSSKLRLSKQAEVEMTEDAECVKNYNTEAVPTVESGEDHSPHSDGSDHTVVPSDKPVSTVSTPKDSSPEDVKNIDSENKASPTQVVNVKVRLVRSQAVCDDVSSSPPPDMLQHSGARTLSVSPTILVRHAEKQKLGHDNSQSSTVSESGTSPALSRDSSFDAAYTDSTGTNLEEFIIKTLNKNRNDRSMLLHLESDMINFIRDTRLERHKFPQMSSYHRMLVHRVAAFFGLEHNVDESGKCVVVNRSQSTRIPEFKFRDHIWEELSHDDQPKKLILRRHRDRDCTSLEECLGSDRVVVDDRKSKSFEEREEQYMEARNRIFQQQHSQLAQSGPVEQLARPTTLCTPDSHTSSKEDVRWPTADIRQWSSTDSSGYSTDSSSRLRVNVTKASSFHGVTLLTRGDSHLSKTDSLSSGASNLSSPVVLPPSIGYAVRSADLPESTTTAVSSAASSSPNADGSQQAGSPFLSFTGERGEPLAIWVASAIEQIPAGSFIINPQTGEPYVNADGTLYRWFPPATSAESKTAVQMHHVSVGKQDQDTKSTTSSTVLSESSALGTTQATTSSVTRSLTQYSILPPVNQTPIQYLCRPAPSYQLMSCQRHEIPSGGLQYRLVSPQAGSTTVQLLTLPEMTVQSVETYPASQHAGCLETYPFSPPTGYVQSAVGPSGMSCDCAVETEAMAQLRLDTKSKGHVIYAPLQSGTYSVLKTDEVTDSSSLHCTYYTSLGHGGQRHPSPGSFLSPPPPGPFGQQVTSPRSYDDLHGCDIYTPQTVLIPCTNSSFRQPTANINSGETRLLAPLHQQRFHPPFNLSIPKQRMASSGAVYGPPLPQVYTSPASNTLHQNSLTLNESSYQLWPSWPSGQSSKSCCSHILQVCGLPAGLLCTHLDTYLSDLVTLYGARQFDVISSGALESSSVESCTILAVFDNEAAAQKALLSHSSAVNSRYWLQIYHHHHHPS